MYCVIGSGDDAARAKPKSAILSVVASNQKVLWLDITMHETSRVQIGQALDELLDKRLDLGMIQFGTLHSRRIRHSRSALLEKLVEVSVRHVLENEIQSLVFANGFSHRDNLGMT
jgi:hypothetical protein